MRNPYRSGDGGTYDRPGNRAKIGCRKGDRREVEMGDGVRRERIRGWLRFTVHFVQMIIAMVVGMLVLDPVWRLILPASAQRFGVLAIVMATDMSIGMAVWMRVRRH